MAKSKNKRIIRIGNKRYELGPLFIPFVVVVAALVIAVIALLIVRQFYHPSVDTATVDTPNAPATTVRAIQVQSATLEPSHDPTEEPTPSPTPVPTPTPEPTLRAATIRSLGEFIADNDVLKAAYIRQTDEEGNDTSSFDFSSMFDLIGASVGNADYTVAEVDGTMGGKGVNGYRGKNGEYNTPPHIMLAMRENGVDMLTLANDHALDELYDGLAKTLSNCERAEIDYVGAAASQEEHDTPKIVEINGINVAFINYTDSFNGKEKNAAKDALAFGVNYTEGANFTDVVEAARAAGADVVIAYMSWGKQDSEKITNEQISLARSLVNAGVDVIIGFNPRVIQSQPTVWLEVEKEDGTVQRTLAICSLGTFLSAAEDTREDHGMIFEFTITETERGVFEITNPAYIPTYVWVTEGTDGTKDYKVLAVGDWLTSPPDGMSDKDYERLKAVWSDMQTQLGTTELEIKAN